MHLDSDKGHRDDLCKESCTCPCELCEEAREEEIACEEMHDRYLDALDWYYSSGVMYG